MRASRETLSSGGVARSTGMVGKSLKSNLPKGILGSAIPQTVPLRGCSKNRKKAAL